MTRRRLTLAASAALAALLLWWFLRGVHLDTAWTVIRGADPGYVLAAAAVSLLGFGFRILRWRHLVAPIKWIGLRSLAAATFGGWAVTALLPGRLGEVARAVLLKRREGVSTSAVFGTVVVERLLDALAVLLLLSASLAVLPASSDAPADGLMSAIRAGALVAFAGLTTIALVILGAHTLPVAARSRMRRGLGRLPGPFGRLGWRVVESFGTGLGGALVGRDATHRTGPGRRLRVAFHTAALWATICAVHLLLFRAFGIAGSAAQVPPLLFLITLGLAVPTPAAIGSYHMAVQLGLTGLLGVPNETAVGYALVSHVVTLVPPATIGIIQLAREGLRLSNVDVWTAAAPAPAARPRPRG